MNGGFPLRFHFVSIVLSVVALEKNLQSLGTSRDREELRQNLWVTHRHTHTLALGSNHSIKTKADFWNALLLQDKSHKELVHAPRCDFSLLVISLRSDWSSHRHQRGSSPVKPSFQIKIYQISIRKKSYSTILRVGEHKQLLRYQETQQSSYPPIDPHNKGLSGHVKDSGKHSKPYQRTVRLSGQKLAC